MGSFLSYSFCLQPIIGLDRPMSLVGKLKCFDVNIVARKKLVYDKALTEITPDKPPPSKLRVCPAPGHVAIVDVHYSWKPDIYTTCCFFSHIVDS